MMQNQLNEKLKSITSDQFELFITKKKQVSKKREKHTTYNITQNLLKIIEKLNLLEIENAKERYYIFIGYCYEKAFRYNTILKYTNTLIQNDILDKNISIKIHKTKTMNRNTVILKSDYMKFVNYVFRHISKTNYPVILAITFGLRTFEILQFKISTLVALNSQQNEIDIYRKSTIIDVIKKWIPIYSKTAEDVIRIGLILYNLEYITYNDNAIDVILFPINSTTLVRRIKSLFLKATKKIMPEGMGIHTCRRMGATLMAEHTDNINAIKAFLQHSNINTTQKYIKKDYEKLKDEFNKITQEKIYDLTSLLK